MKKYFFSILAIALAIGFTAFTSVKSTKPTSLTRMVFTGSATTSGSITQKNVNNTRYVNWATITPTCSLTADQKACVIDVDPKYLDSNDVLYAIDPDGVGTKEAFPMSETSNVIGTTTYYKVSTNTIANDREIHNAVAP